MGWNDPHAELRAIHLWFQERELDLDCHQRANGRWRAVVTDPTASRGAASLEQRLVQKELGGQVERGEDHPGQRIGPV